MTEPEDTLPHNLPRRIEAARLLKEAAARHEETGRELLATIETVGALVAPVVRRWTAQQIRDRVLVLCAQTPGGARFPDLVSALSVTEAQARFALSTLRKTEHVEMAGDRRLAHYRATRLGKRSAAEIVAAGGAT